MNKRASNKDKYTKGARCRKLLYKTNAIWIKGLPYGSECANIVLGDILERGAFNEQKQIPEGSYFSDKGN